MNIKTIDGFTLDCSFQNAHSNKGIIFAHGITIDKDGEGIFVRADEELFKLGYSTVRFTFRGHGNSSGDSISDFTISGQQTDLSTIFSFMRSQGVEVFGLAGASFGGGASALYAGTNAKEVKALFLANPVLNYEQAFLNPSTPWTKKHFSSYEKKLEQDGYVEIGSHKFKAGNQLFDDMKRYKPYKELQKYTGPIFLAQGTEDSKINYKDVEDTYNSISNSNKEIKIIQGSEHGFFEEPYETQVTQMIIEFFKKHVTI